eukprot:TRINITY_DN3296_c0_g3_i1.p1 TRINITY_DN3296_c0_g3~~TRINITY_DN3296_c0_g3_i1.p1  ORF type:complete len:158 (-),score=83.92 TRINITY_DN3296_c0_g3_i1:40-513(-)
MMDTINNNNNNNEILILTQNFGQKLDEEDLISPIINYELVPLYETQLFEACFGDLEFEKEIWETFIEQYQSKINKLQLKIASQNIIGDDTAFKIAHELKGACANIGANNLRRGFERIEALTKHHLFEPALKLIPLLNQEFLILSKIFEQRFEQMEEE